MLLAASPRGGFGLRLVFNVLWIGAAAWYFYGPDTVSSSGGPGVIVTQDGTRVDMQSEAEGTSAMLEGEATRLDGIVRERARLRAEDEAEHQRWLESFDAPQEPLDRGGVRVNRGLSPNGDGPRRIRVAPLQ